jgi:hypothetical protein
LQIEVGNSDVGNLYYPMGETMWIHYLSVIECCAWSRIELSFEVRVYVRLLARSIFFYVIKSLISCVWTLKTRILQICAIVTVILNDLDGCLMMIPKFPVGHALHVVLRVKHFSKMTGVENVLVTRRRWISIFVSPGVALVSTWHAVLLSFFCCTVCHKHTEATFDIDKIKFTDN